ncbi:hypothetical protein F5B20DRAFT_585369 [Whalleya microplaca]|nr:hypothetical protein F5B20DRAFT_585369 [Whalleya microplaca]
MGVQALQIFTLRSCSISSVIGAPRRAWHFAPPLRSFSATATVRGTLANVIKHDHQELKAYHPHIVGPKDLNEQTRYQNLFVWELARHSVAEEIIVLPAIREQLEDGSDVAQRYRDQHQKIKEQLHKFQSLNADTEDFMPTFRNLYSDLQEYIKEEEDHDIPQLEAKLDDSQLAKLSRAFERTKLLAPTRSHPLAPNAPPFETAAALLAAPIDKLTDILRKFPKEDKLS